MAIISCPSHPLRQRIEAILKPSGVTWEEVASVPVPDLVRKADGRLREWVLSLLLTEAASLGLNEGDSAPLWREWSDGPRKYLYESQEHDVLPDLPLLASSVQEIYIHSRHNDHQR
jgi:hypothetical protein